MASSRAASYCLTLLASALSCTLAPAAAAAQTLWRPPQVLSDTLVHATAPRVPIRRVALGSVHITLDSTTLAAVHRAFPGGRYGESGDAGDYMRWLCYVSAADTDRSILWLVSDEMGGGNSIMSFTLERVPAAARIDRRCAKLPESGSALDLPRSLQLGAARSEVVSALGSPSYNHGDTLVYSYQHHVPARHGKPADYGYDVTSELCLVLRGDHLVLVQAWYLEST